MPFTVAAKLAYIIDIFSYTLGLLEYNVTVYNPCVTAFTVIDEKSGIKSPKRHKNTQKSPKKVTRNETVIH